VLALYRAGQDGFTFDDQRIVHALVSGLGQAIEMAGKQKASASAAN